MDKRKRKVAVDGKAGRKVELIRNRLMRFLITILLLLVSSFTFAQSSLKDAVAKFDAAVTSKDTIALKQLLHDDLSYGHSNAWIETKSDLMKNLYNGKLSYSKVETKDLNITESGDHANVRSTTEIEYLLDGKEGKLKLHVLQVWIKTNKGWQLIARQSAKLEK